MALLPDDSPLAIVCTASSVSVEVILTAVTYFQTTEPFDRVEWSNDRVRNAPNTDGSGPVFLTAQGNLPVQVTNNCTPTAIRNVAPDDANVDNIKRRWDITRYTVTGGDTRASDLNSLFPISVDHKKRLSRFQAHIAEGSMNLSYDYLIAMRSEDFSYITTTGVTLTGAAVDGTVNDVLITELVIDPAYEDTIDDEVILKKWTATFETRVNRPLASLA